MKQPAGTINVGRSTSGGAFGGLFGNKFRRGDVCPSCGGSGESNFEACWICDGNGQLVNNDHCMRLYEAWLILERSKPDSQMRAALESLRGKTLWCPGCGLNSPMCHARVIEKVMNESRPYRIGRNGKLSLIQQARNESCRKCGLYESSKYVCIMGRGNVMSPIVLLGEAPGETESTTGEPFRGRSGQWLQQQVDDLGMTSMVYITNSVRCRPPENRKPTALEITTCKPYLERELQIIKPKVVVALGKVAMDSLGISSAERHQALHSVRHPFRIILTWHPSYVLRMGGSSSRVAQDFVNSLKIAKELVK